MKLQKQISTTSFFLQDYIIDSEIFLKKSRNLKHNENCITDFLRIFGTSRAMLDKHIFAW